MPDPTKVTIATTSGLAWAGMIAHFGSGLIGIVTGYAALVVAKGGAPHKRLGLVFTWAMAFTGLTAAGIYAFTGRFGSVPGALLVAYYVITATTALRPFTAEARTRHIALMIVPLVSVALGYWAGFIALGRPRMVLDGVPGPMFFFLSTVGLCALIGDLRMLRAGGITGTRRIARHLWRMCFAFFFATGSFFFGQMKFIPEQIRFMPMIIGLGVAPLVALLYWMWRVRLRSQLRGLILKPVARSSG